MKKESNMTLTFRIGFLYSALSIVLIIAGCNKTKNFKDLNLLVQKEWQLTSVTSNGIDVSNDCDLDDVLKFEDDSKFDYNFGVLECDNDNLEKTAKSWKIIDDYTVLRMKYKIRGNSNGSAIDYWKIIELSDSLLIVEDDLAEENNQIPEVRTYQIF